MRGWIFALLVMVATPVAAHDLPICYDDPETAALRSVSDEELASHGGGPLGPVDYPAGTLHRNFSFFVSYVIDLDGHVSCITATEDIFMSVDYREAEMTPQRKAMLDALATRTFTPFTNSDGQPEKVVVDTQVDEQELPYQHVPPPPGDLASTVIRLQTSGHRTPEHGYTMVIDGSGNVTFDDRWRSTSYRIPLERVSAMLDLANGADFWSLKDVYTPPLDPTTPWAYVEHGGYYRRVTIMRGSHAKTVTIYDWGIPGAPVAARDLMEEMAFLGGLDIFGMWGTTSDTIALKIYNGFDFSSAKGGRLLIDAVYSTGLTDSDIYGLIARGAPINYVERGAPIDTGLLDAAIDGNRWELADNLIAQGALLTNEKLDKTKITRAFVHAVAVASPDMVRRLLALKPDLTFQHDVDNGICREMKVTDPVVTYTGAFRDQFFGDDPEGTSADLIDVARQMRDAGADLNARDACGGNIFTHAYDNNQLEFARWLLAQGVSSRMADGSWPGRYSYPISHGMTLLLLDAGADQDPEFVASALSNAQSNPGLYPQLEAWLRAHGKWQDDAPGQTEPLQ